VDRQRGIKMFEEFLNGDVSDPGRAIDVVQALDVLEVLERPEIERPLWIARMAGPYWRPGREDTP
jgi:hypothetical protein